MSENKKAIVNKIEELKDLNFNNNKYFKGDSLYTGEYQHTINGDFVHIKGEIKEGLLVGETVFRANGKKLKENKYENGVLKSFTKFNDRGMKDGDFILNQVTENGALTNKFQVNKVK